MAGRQYGRRVDIKFGEAETLNLAILILDQQGCWQTWARARLIGKAAGSKQIPEMPPILTENLFSKWN